MFLGGCDLEDMKRRESRIFMKLFICRLRGFTLSYILHTRAFGTYLFGGLFTL